MSKHPEARIAKFQWLALAIGLALMGFGLWLTIRNNPGTGFALTVGSLGWFLLSLMLSPQVRKDLFRGRFDCKTSDEVYPKSKASPQS